MSNSDTKSVKEHGVLFSKPNTMVQSLSKNSNVKIPAKNRSVLSIKKPYSFIFFQIAEFVDEVLILRQLRHTNIVLFMSYILNPPTDMCIVMHWCSSSLYRRVHVKKEEITVSKAIRIAIETAQVI